MNKPIITISGWEGGIANSPNNGFGNMVGVSYEYTPGAVQINRILSKVSSTTVTETPRWILKDPNVSNNYYAVSSAKVYKSTDAGATWSVVAGHTAATIYGAAIWKNYLWIFHSTGVDLYGYLSGTATWTNSWSGLTLNAMTYHPAITPQNDKLYIGSGRFVDSIAEAAGKTFLQSDATSYVSSATALDLPTGVFINSFAYLGTKLQCLTNDGIYPWDTVSTSFNSPIQTSDKYTHCGLALDNVMYFIAGERPKLYSTNGSYIKYLMSFPSYVFDFETVPGTTFYVPDGSMCLHNGKILFNTTKGIGAYVPETGTFRFENLTSNGEVTLGSVGGLLSVTREEYLCGWGYSTAFGIDKTLVTAAAPVTATYLPFIETALYRVGSTNEKRTLSGVEIVFYKQLTANKIRLKYRTDISGSWTTIGEYDTTGVTSITKPITIVGAVNLQFRIDFAYSYANTMTEYDKVKEINIYG